MAAAAEVLPPTHPTAARKPRERETNRGIPKPRARRAGGGGARAGGGLPDDERKPGVIRRSFPPTQFGTMNISACTEIGRRKAQEDRLVVHPMLAERADCALIGVFDGTVGDHASEYAHRHLLGKFLRHRGIAALIEETEGEARFQEAVLKSLASAMRSAFVETDAELLELCAEHGYDYTSSTAVVACVMGRLLTIAHLGDSRIVLGSESGGSMTGTILTRDHKPDQPSENERVRKHGGSLTYLHGGKPFLRGGDFAERQAKGDRPMQLNYSRAFGGKDLKPFGLTADPTVQQFDLIEEDRVLILASDGVWDVLDPHTAVRVAWECHLAGVDPARDLVHLALRQHDIKGTIDNVTAVVLILRPSA